MGQRLPFLTGCPLLSALFYRLLEDAFRLENNETNDERYRGIQQGKGGPHSISEMSKEESLKKR